MNWNHFAPVWLLVRGPHKHAGSRKRMKSIRKPTAWQMTGTIESLQSMHCFLDMILIHRPHGVCSMGCQRAI